MAESYITSLVQCPFFRKVDQRKISCEGPYDDCECVSQIFKNNQGRNLQLRLFCQGNYENCEIYRMIKDAKY